MQEIDYTKIGTRIRRARKEKGWSQCELAKQCGISMSFIGHIERGTRIMSLDTFAKVCMSLGVDADGLLWGTADFPGHRLADMWGHPGEDGLGNYAMYVRIMESVADILQEV